MSTPVLPPAFVAEVAAARAELGEVAPRMMALADRYRMIERTFNELVPRAEQYETDAVWSVPWTECGGEQLQHRLDEFVELLAGRFGRSVW